MRKVMLGIMAILLTSNIFGLAFGNQPSPTITATLDLAPDILNLKSRGKWITAYIELPEEYNVRDIDVHSIRLRLICPMGGVYTGNLLNLVPVFTKIYDGNLMVKFSRIELTSYIRQHIWVAWYGDVVIIVTGEVGWTSFRGYARIEVLLN